MYIVALFVHCKWVPWYACKMAYKPKPTKKAEHFQHLRDVATTKMNITLKYHLSFKMCNKNIYVPLSAKVKNQNNLLGFVFTISVYSSSSCMPFTDVE